MAPSVIGKTASPSEGCFSTSVIARVCRAPGRFSTMTRQPCVSEISVAMIRPTTSGGEPPPAGTKMRIVRSPGNVSALESGIDAAADKAPAPHRRTVRRLSMDMCL